MLEEGFEEARRRGERIYRDLEFRIFKYGGEYCYETVPTSGESSNLVYRIEEGFKPKAVIEIEIEEKEL